MVCFWGFTGFTRVRINAGTNPWLTGGMEEQREWGWMAFRGFTEFTRHFCPVPITLSPALPVATGHHFLSQPPPNGRRCSRLVSGEVKDSVSPPFNPLESPIFSKGSGLGRRGWCGCGGLQDSPTSNLAGSAPPRQFHEVDEDPQGRHPNGVNEECGSLDLADLPPMSMWGERRSECSGGGSFGLNRLNKDAW